MTHVYDESMINGKYKIHIRYCIDCFNGCSQLIWQRLEITREAVRMNVHELAMSMSSVRKDMVGGKDIIIITLMTLPDLEFYKIYVSSV